MVKRLSSSNAKKNEKLVPLDELAEPYRNVTYNKRLLGDQSYIKPFLKLMRTLPYDRHLLPDVLLRDTPEAVFYSGLSILSPRTIGTKTLVAIDLEGNQGAVRHMDRERYQQIMGSLEGQLKSELKERGDEVRAAYKEAQLYLTSTEFWEKYLGLDEADEL